MRRSQRVLAGFAALLLTAVIAAPVAMAAGPDRIAIDLDDPQVDVDDSAFWSAECGFEISVDNRGQVRGLLFSAGARSVVELWVYNIRATYTNVATGVSVTVRDDGPDRFYVRDGMAYVAVTGRSTTGTGTIGVLVFDTGTWEIVHEAGRDVGVFYDTLCDSLTG